jgi:hypothetical protein
VKGIYICSREQNSFFASQLICNKFTALFCDKVTGVGFAGARFIIGPDEKIISAQF